MGRQLSLREQSVLDWVLSDPTLEAGRHLRAQVPHARVVSEMSTFLVLTVSSASPAVVLDGSLPIETIVLSPTNELAGFIVIWVTSGFLSGLDYAWLTFDPPDDFPSPDRLQRMGRRS